MVTVRYRGPLYSGAIWQECGLLLRNPVPLNICLKKAVDGLQHERYQLIDENQCQGSVIAFKRHGEHRVCGNGYIVVILTQSGGSCVIAVQEKRKETTKNINLKE